MQTIALVGRPNVGKSSLFNLLLGQRAALVDSQAGVTRDRHPRMLTCEERSGILVDTAGIVAATNEMEASAQDQTTWAISEATAIVFLVDGTNGLMPDDYTILLQLQKSQKNFIICLNKTDAITPATSDDFYRLPQDKIIKTSAVTKQGIKTLKEKIYTWLEPQENTQTTPSHGPCIAILGRPNAGKSTLVNYLAKTTAVVVSNIAGTTTDSIDIPIKYGGKPYTLIDTAGIRRKSRVKTQFEHACILRSLQAISKANVVFFMIDASIDITEQDCKLLNTVIESGRPCQILVNKWDSLSDYDRRQLSARLKVKLKFANFIPLVMISALHGNGLRKAFTMAKPMLTTKPIELATSACTNILEQALENHQPPVINGRRIKLRYAHLISNHPVIIMIHGKQIQALPQSYTRYLAAFYRSALQLNGQHVIIKFKNDHNPYAPSS